MAENLGKKYRDEGFVLDVEREPQVHGEIQVRPGEYRAYKRHGDALVEFSAETREQLEEQIEAWQRVQPGNQEQHEMTPEERLASGVATVESWVTRSAKQSGQVYVNSESTDETGPDAEVRVTTTTAVTDIDAEGETSGDPVAEELTETGVDAKVAKKTARSSKPDKG
jgi:hypothetical protein